MLPSSHFVPITGLLTEAPSEGEGIVPSRSSAAHFSVGTQSREIRKGWRQPVPDGAGDESEAQAQAVLLADAFSEFISASSRLENSYRELQGEVSELGVELAERNAALNTSLAENERMRLALQQILDSLPCGVLVVDGDGAIAMINPESRRLLGLDALSSIEEGVAFNGQLTTLRQISSDSGVNLQSFYENELSSDAAQEFCVPASSGKRWLEIRSRRLFRKSNDIPGSKPDQTILILRDTSAQKRAEQEREAGRKAMALAEITTILAHEIRNPLASMELFAGLIETDGSSAEQWVSHLRAGIRSLSATVNNVLSFHGSGALQLAPLDVASLIGNALNFVQPLADQASVTLRWLGGGEAVVMGNESALQQVVLNVVSNAIRHTPAGGCITVSLRMAAGNEEHGRSGADGTAEHVLVEVSDTGPGIRADQIAHVFEPGFSGSGDSSGLGLAVCERIMKGHGGRISVTSAPLGSVPCGARFLLDFPVASFETVAMEMATV